VSFSHGEIADLARKAGRGAGLAWGAAEELAWAARWLTERALPGPEAASWLLTGADGRSALEAGLALADAAVLPRRLALGVVAAPLLLVPFLSRRAEGGHVVVNAGRWQFHVGADGTDLDGSLGQSADVVLWPKTGSFTTRAAAARVGSIDPAALDSLERLAARTYAPATEASRMQGAGAGVTDND